MEYGKYQIKTTFYQGKNLIRVNHAKFANAAVIRAVGHMQTNHYGATVAEVYDEQTGELHAVLTRSVSGMKILFKREIEGDLGYEGKR
jgi:hypothetical protein